MGYSQDGRTIVQLLQIKDSSVRLKHGQDYFDTYFCMQTIDLSAELVTNGLAVWEKEAENN